MSRHRDVALPTNSRRRVATPADRTRSGPAAAGLLVLAVLLASVAAGCGRGDQTASTTGGSVSGTTTRAGAGTSSAPPTTSGAGSSPGSAVGEPGSPGEVPPSPGGGVTTPSSRVPGPTTTCVRGPATTAPGQRGGGEITCSTLPPDGSVSSPPMTDTTIPVDEAPPLQPDGSHGVLRGSVGGSACPATAGQCIDLYRLVPASVVARGPVQAGAHTAAFGEYQLLVPPGRYEVVATPDAGGNTCVPTTVDVVAGEVVAASVDCRPAS